MLWFPQPSIWQVGEQPSSPEMLPSSQPSEGIDLAVAAAPTLRGWAADAGRRRTGARDGTTRRRTDHRIRPGAHTFLAAVAAGARVFVVARGAIELGRILARARGRIADSRLPALAGGRAGNRIRAHAGASLTGVGSGTAIAVRAHRTVGLFRVGAQASGRVADPSAVALIGRRADDRTAANAGTCLAGVGLRARVTVRAGRSIGFLRAGADAGGLIANSGIVALIGWGTDNRAGPDAHPGLTRVNLGTGVAVAAGRSLGGAGMAARAVRVAGIDGARVVVVAGRGRASGETVLEGQCRAGRDVHIPTQECAGPDEVRVGHQGTVRHQHQGPNLVAGAEGRRLRHRVQGSGAAVDSRYFDADVSRRKRRTSSGPDDCSARAAPAIGDAQLDGAQGLHFCAGADGDIRHLVDAGGEPQRAARADVDAGVLTRRCRHGRSRRHGQVAGADSDRRGGRQRWQWHHRGNGAVTDPGADRQVVGLHIAYADPGAQPNRLGDDVPAGLNR